MTIARTCSNAHRRVSTVSAEWKKSKQVDEDVWFSSKKTKRDQSQSELQKIEASNQLEKVDGISLSSEAANSQKSDRTLEELEHELLKLGESTKLALEYSWEKVERTQRENIALLSRIEDLEREKNMSTTSSMNGERQRRNSADDSYESSCPKKFWNESSTKLAKAVRRLSGLNVDRPFNKSEQGKMSRSNSSPPSIETIEYFDESESMFEDYLLNKLALVEAEKELSAEDHQCEIQSQEEKILLLEKKLETKNAVIESLKKQLSCFQASGHTYLKDLDDFQQQLVKNRNDMILENGWNGSIEKEVLPNLSPKLRNIDVFNQDDVNESTKLLLSSVKSK